MYMGLAEQIPQAWLPTEALGSSARVTYGLVARAGNGPIPSAELSRDERDGLAAHDGLGDWLLLWQGEEIDASDDDEPSPSTADLEKPCFRDDQATAAAMWLDHAALYRLLLDRDDDHEARRHTPAIALTAAGNLAGALQPLRRRQDLLNALIADPARPAVPAAQIDPLLFSLLTLTDTSEDPKGALTANELTIFLESRAFAEWLSRLTVPTLFDAPPAKRHPA
jgi:hypothetical protein